MDPITHVLLGASASYALWGRKLGRTAALGGGFAAFVPDGDVFIRSAADPLIAIEYHRGFTHALAFAPVSAAIVAAFWLIRPSWRNRARWLTLWAACTFATVTHCLLDSATSYGTQLFWPFSRHRVGWDWISIIDPVFTGALLLGLVWALVRQRLRPAFVALIFGAAYLTLGSLQHSRALNTQGALALSRGHTVDRSEVMPTLGNTIIWRALYEHEGKVYSDRIRVGWFSKPEVREGWSVPLVDAADLNAAERARDTRDAFARFTWFSDDWVARSPADPNILADMRYSLSTAAFDPIWGIRFTPPGEPTEIIWVNRSRDRKVDPRELWNEITGSDPKFRALPKVPDSI